MSTTLSHQHTSAKELLVKDYAPYRDDPCSDYAALQQDSACREEPSDLTENQPSLPEALFQIIWNEQWLPKQLTTEEGHSVEIVSPGLWNVEAGPDFKDAVISIDGESKHGHVEIHRRCRDWYNHGHFSDASYENVILHVVYEPPSTSEDDLSLPPCIALRHILRHSQDTLQHLVQHTEFYAGRITPGFCAARWAFTEDNAVTDILRAAGLARFGDKVQRLSEVINRLGPDQAFYEGLFDGLGYKANRRAFCQLAQDVPLQDLKQLDSSKERFAALFGAAGFLPDISVPQGLDEDTLSAAKELWHAWWLQGRTPSNVSWNQKATRPGNSPQKRLAAGYLLLERLAYSPSRYLTDVLTDETDAKNLLRRLQECLYISENKPPFLSLSAMHAPNDPSGAALLGKKRVQDLLANIVLPWLKALAQRRNQPDKQKIVEEAFMCLPRLQSNRPLKEAQYRFLVPPDRGRSIIRQACEQQGILDIYQRFCCRLNHACYICNLFHQPVGQGQRVH